MTNLAKAALKRHLIKLLEKLIVKLTARLAEQQAQQDASESVANELETAQDIANSEATDRELTEEPCENCEAHKKSEMLAHFLDLMAKREGTEDHIAAEGDFTRSYGIKDGHVEELISGGYLTPGTDISDFTSSRAYANAIYGATYDRMLTRYNVDVLGKLSNATMAEIMSAEINLGSFNGDLKTYLDSGEIKKYTDELLYYYNSDGMPMLGLAKRRAIEYNRIRESAGIGGPFIASIETTGTRESTAVRYLDSEGTAIFQGNANPLHPQSSLGSMSISTGALVPDNPVQDTELQGSSAELQNLEDFPIFNQTNSSDTNLYISKEWAETKVSYFGNMTARSSITCLSTVYAMIEHARGNTDYRIGNSGTWSDNDGAYRISGETARDLAPDVNVIRAQISNGNPVVLKGYSPRMGTNHFMLAVGVTNENKIKTLDPLTGQQIIIDGDTMNASINTGTGQLSYEVQSIRTFEF